MTKTIHAVFDGEVLCPEEPLEIRPDTRVLITIEFSNKLQKKKRSFLQTAKSLNLKGPSDWSAKFEDYLYDREKDSDEEGVS